MVIMKSFAYILYFALIGISNCHELTGKKKEVAYSDCSTIHKLKKETCFICQAQDNCDFHAFPFGIGICTEAGKQELLVSNITVSVNYSWYERSQFCLDIDAFLSKRMEDVCRFSDPLIYTHDIDLKNPLEAYNFCTWSIKDSTQSNNLFNLEVERKYYSADQDLLLVNYIMEDSSSYKVENSALQENKISKYKNLASATISFRAKEKNIAQDSLKFRIIVGGSDNTDSDSEYGISIILIIMLLGVLAICCICLCICYACCKRHIARNREEEVLSPEERGRRAEQVLNKYTEELDWKAELSAFGQDSCCICLEQFTTKTRIRRMGCAHIIHSICLRSWMAERLDAPVCPICQRALSEKKISLEARSAEEVSMDNTLRGDAVVINVHPRGEDTAKKPIDKKPEIIAVEINCLFDNNIELHPAQLNTTIQKLFKINGRKILINENQSMAEGTGFKVWDSSLIVSKCLEGKYRENKLLFEGRNILELGCGTGFLSLALQALGSVVIATDLPQIIEYSTIPNISLNHHHEIPHNNVNIEGGSIQEYSPDLRCIPLDWGWVDDLDQFNRVLDEIGEIDYILGADLIFNHQHLLYLPKVLKGIVEHQYEKYKKDIIIIMAYKSRNAHIDDLIFPTMQEYKFTGEQLEDKEYDGDYKSQRIDTFIIYTDTHNVVNPFQNICYIH